MPGTGTQESRGKGALFVLEGPDDVGKSTLAAEAERALKSSNPRVVRLAFPGHIPGTLGAHVYALHHDPSRFGIDQLTPTSLQALHVAAHLDAIQARIRPLFEEGHIVLLDRFWWSTWVFGVVTEADRDALEALVRLEQVFWGPLQPTAVFLVDRATNESGHQRPVIERIRHEYAALAAREAARVPVISVQNDGPLATATDRIVGTVRRLTETPTTTRR
jgi:thymidylate kinase